MTTAQYTTVTATVFRPVTLEAPRTLTENTDAATMRDALEVFAVLSGSDTVQAVALANIAAVMTEGGAVIVTYTHDDCTMGRVLFPSAIFLTKENAVCIRAWCAFRRETKCFRLDRMDLVHPFALPGEVAA